MKFYGTPNMGVFEMRKKNRRDPKPRRVLVFRFDENGEYVTTDLKLIEKLSRKFKHDDENISGAVSDKAEEIESKVEVKLRQCKKCDFACETQGGLLKHYREQHPKEG